MNSEVSQPGADVQIKNARGGACRYTTVIKLYCLAFDQFGLIPAPLDVSGIARCSTVGSQEPQQRVGMVG